MKHSTIRLLSAGALAACALPASAAIYLYSGQNFRGDVVSVAQPVSNLRRLNFNDAASSIVIDRGRWEVCDHAEFGGDCVVLRRGSYADLNRFGLSNRVSSVRPVSGPRGNAYGRRISEYEPDAEPYTYRRRPGEALYDARVLDVRAVYRERERTCWIESAPGSASGDQVGGAILGAIVGGVLGHQIGGGRGQDIATAGGAVAGAAIGSRIAGGNGRAVERCSTTAAGAPEYYDVTYEFRGRTYTMQTRVPPGSTVVVNRDGVPRG